MAKHSLISDIDAASLVALRIHIAHDLLTEDGQDIKLQTMAHVQDSRSRVDRLVFASLD